MRSRQIRRIFFRAFLQQICTIWPILSGVILTISAPGLLIGYIEGWGIGDLLYFSFVTGLTIGYGDLTPQTSRVANSRCGDWPCRYRVDRPHSCD